jgi:hypothetical protein
MLVFRERTATIIRFPTIAVMLLAAWALLEVGVLSGHTVSSKVEWGFAVAVASTVMLGVRVIRRAGEEIRSVGLVGSRKIAAGRAALGVYTRGTGKYSGIHLELVTRGTDFHSPSRSGTNIAVDVFEPTGLEMPLRVARRAARVLGLPEPLLGPGLVDPTARGPVEGRTGFSLASWWASVSPKARFAALAVVIVVAWTGLTGRATARLVLRCTVPLTVRDASMTFNFSCAGPAAKMLKVPAGHLDLDVWDPRRACWTMRAFDLVADGRIVVDVDEVVRTSNCVETQWAPP